MAKATFFSTLVVDELVAIVQQPSFQHERFLDFWIHGPFARAMPNIFRTMFVGTGDLPITDSRSGTIHVGIQTDVRETYLVCGRIFENLRFNPNYFPMFIKEDLDNLPLLFKKGACLEMVASGMECMESKFSRDPFLEKLSEGFRSLKLDWSHHSLTADIPGRILKSFHSWTGLKAFEYSGRNPGVLIGLWGKLGSLERLRVIIRGNASITGLWKLLLLYVCSSCRQLTDVFFSDLSKDITATNVDYANFLTSYGQQLVNANLQSVKSEFLVRIASACPNLRCTFSETSGRLTRIAALGKVIRVLFLTIPRSESEEALVTAFKRCSALEELSLVCSTHEVHPNLFTALFSKHMDNVKKLTIDTYVASGHLKEVAKSFRYLEELHITGITKSGARALKPILEANPDIKHLHIVEYRQDADEVESTMIDEGLREILAYFRTKKVKYSVKFHDGTQISGQ